MAGRDLTKASEDLGLTPDRDKWRGSQRVGPFKELSPHWLAQAGPWTVSLMLEPSHKATALSS